MTVRLFPALMLATAVLATACGSSSGGERAMQAVRDALVSPGARLVLGQLQCDARADSGSVWTVACAPGPDAEYRSSPTFQVNVDDLSVTAANEDAQRLLALSEPLQGGRLRECTFEEDDTGALRIKCDD